MPEAQPQPRPAISRPSRASLVGTRLFASPYLSSDERLALDNASSAPRSIGAGEELVRESEHTDQFHIVSEGWACRYKTTREGSRQIVALLVPGDTANLDTFSFDSLNYGVRALTMVKVLTIPRDRLLALAEKHPGIAQSLAWLAMIENASLSQWALCLGRQSAKQRLAHLFCEMSVRLGSGEDETSFGLPLTQEQIADALGLTAVHVNRTIQHLRTEGVIEAKARAVTIVDMEELRRISDFDPAYLHNDQEPFAGEAGRPAVPAS